MTTAWERLGLVFRAEGQRDWMQTHAQMPHAEHVDGDNFRVYFTTRDARNRSHIAWLVVDLKRPDRLLDLAYEPLLAPGAIGQFDDVGVMTSCLVKTETERRFYTIGWNIKTPAPMHTSIGMAVGPASDAPSIMQRFAGPIFERNPINPYYVSCPWVQHDSQGWRMWYMAGMAWGARADGTPASRYNVWHARSDDGIYWRPDADVALDLAHPGELAIARPQVLRDDDTWRMWHCYRGENFDYRIGYAESADGAHWTRRDDHPLALLAAGAGFDSEATCYPFVFDHSGERWMLYCGDRYGQAGFGLARQRRELRQ
jgi:hypothetical protein